MQDIFDRKCNMGGKIYHCECKASIVADMLKLEIQRANEQLLGRSGKSKVVIRGLVLTLTRPISVRITVKGLV